jgi:hypothetical protein
MDDERVVEVIETKQRMVDHQVQQDMIDLGNDIRCHSNTLKAVALSQTRYNPKYRPQITEYSSRDKPEVVNASTWCQGRRGGSVQSENKHWMSTGGMNVIRHSYMSGKMHSTC